MKPSPRFVSLILLLSLLLSPSSAHAQVDLSPERWGEEELKRYVRTKRIVEPVTMAESAMITGTSSSIAMRAGLEALKQGGSAMDAALTIALTHVTLAGGCTVSFAGVITIVYYDAESRKVYGLDGGYQTVKGETDPLTIPRSSRVDPSQGSGAIPKGRTVLVPGFMAGLEAGHERFGRLPFPEIFKPAIYFAEKGFPISEGLSRLSSTYREVLSRLPETRAIFTKEDGSLYAAGETFKQPALARTLRKVAAEGTKYIYRGDWAEKFVEAVRRDGGKMTLDDLKSYQAEWSEPIHAVYRGHDVYLASGGIKVAGMLNLLEVSNLADHGYYAESPETFYRLCTIVKAVQFGAGLEGMNYKREDWLRKEFAEKVWEKLENDFEEGADTSAMSRPTHHSDAVVVVDKLGNMAALLHSSNTASVSENGLYIGGISIPDSATFQQVTLSYIKPGDRLANPTVPLIVVKDGRPVLGMSAIGSGMYEESIKCLFNLLGFGKDPQESIDAPIFVPTFGKEVNSPSTSIAVPDVGYPESLIKAAREMGLVIEVLPYAEARRTKGAAAVITMDSDKGFKKAGSVRRFSLGY